LPAKGFIPAPAESLRGQGRSYVGVDFSVVVRGQGGSYVGGGFFVVVRGQGRSYVGGGFFCGCSRPRPLLRKNPNPFSQKQKKTLRPRLQGLCWL